MNREKEKEKREDPNMFRVFVLLFLAWSLIIVGYYTELNYLKFIGLIIIGGSFTKLIRDTNRIKRDSKKQN